MCSFDRAAAGQPTVEPWQYPEPVARRLLRIAFGLIWIFDGILQGQASMPLGMTTQVIEPTAATSPAWVQHLVNTGGDDLEQPPDHGPGFGGVDPGRARRLAARRSAGQLVTSRRARERVLGDRRLDLRGELRGHLRPGLTWAFGAPGRRALLLLRRRVRSPSPSGPGRAPGSVGRSLSVMGLFFVGMAVLQAWPGRGFWQGHLQPQFQPGNAHRDGAADVADPPAGLPRLMGGELRGLRRRARLGGESLPRDRSRPDRARIPERSPGGGPRRRLSPGSFVCLADWVLIEDFGFFGGVGTDPNSMIPMALVFTAGYLAMTRVPVTADAPVPIIAAVPPARCGSG